MDVSVIIINYRTPQLTLDCIESIYKYTSGIQYEVIVVENGSGDNSYALLSKKLPSGVCLIKSDNNLGFGRANNLGFSESKGRNVFFLNSDTLLHDNSIKILSDYLDASPRCGAVGGLLIDGEGKQVKSYGVFPSMKESLLVALSDLKHAVGWKRSIHTKNTINQNDIKSNSFEVDYIQGADLMMKRELFSRLDGFDKNIFMYYEESDLQLRLKKMGFTRVITKDAIITHLEGKSLKESNFKRIAYHRSMMYYMKKYNCCFSFILFKVMLWVTYCITVFLNNNYSRKENIEFLRLFNPCVISNYEA